MTHTLTELCELLESETNVVISPKIEQDFNRIRFVSGHDFDTICSEIESLEKNHGVSITINEKDDEAKTFYATPLNIA